MTKSEVSNFFTNMVGIFLISRHKPFFSFVLQVQVLKAKAERRLPSYTAAAAYAAGIKKILHDYKYDNR